MSLQSQEPVTVDSLLTAICRADIPINETDGLIAAICLCATWLLYEAGLPTDPACHPVILPSKIDVTVPDHHEVCRYNGFTYVQPLGMSPSPFYVITHGHVTEATYLFLSPSPATQISIYTGINKSMYASVHYAQMLDSQFHWQEDGQNVVNCIQLQKNEYLLLVPIEKNIMQMVISKKRTEEHVQKKALRLASQSKEQCPPQLFGERSLKHNVLTRQATKVQRQRQYSLTERCQQNHDRACDTQDLEHAIEAALADIIGGSLRYQEIYDTLSIVEGLVKRMHNLASKNWTWSRSMTQVPESTLSKTMCMVIRSLEDLLLNAMEGVSVVPDVILGR
ncbi:hypothetical protein OG21DRAFT_1527300 [Imleria badia]|nr:hypothetical protein OG21DRAFT_1527300 [Imleria badia]